MLIDEGRKWKRRMFSDEQRLSATELMSPKGMSCLFEEDVLANRNISRMCASKRFSEIDKTNLFSKLSTFKYFTKKNFAH